MLKLYFNRCDEIISCAQCIIFHDTQFFEDRVSRSFCKRYENLQIPTVPDKCSFPQFLLFHSPKDYFPSKYNDRIHGFLPPRIPLATDSIASRNIRLRFIFKALADGSNCPCRLFGVGRRFYFEEFQNFGIRVFPDTEGKRARSCHGQCGRSVV